MALLFVRTGSAVVVVTFTVSLIAVPAAVPFVTFTTNVMVAGAPGARLAFVQISVARVHVQPPGPVSETALVFAGSTSVRVTEAAALGPLLVTTCVYVMLVLASTGTGAGVLVTDRSADPATWILTVAVLLPLLGSLLVDETESV